MQIPRLTETDADVVGLKVCGICILTKAQIIPGPFGGEKFIDHVTWRMFPELLTCPRNQSTTLNLVFGGRED